MFISEERKISSKKGTGIQYIYGHSERFVDYVIENFLPKTGNILDLGGGGFRFAIPAALKGSSLTVVDTDRSSMDMVMLVNRINQNRKFLISLNKAKHKIEIEVKDIFKYLKETPKRYSLISAFRVIHFFTLDKIRELFSLVESKLNKCGLFIISGMTIYNYQSRSSFNELFLNSANASPDSDLYRKFKSTLKAQKIRDSQNLPRYIHFISSDFIEEIARVYNFEVVKSDIPSTRIVNGYVLRKRG